MQSFGLLCRVGTLGLMNSPAEPYNAEFFQSLRDGIRRSASVVVPLLIDICRPQSVVDIGCGTGHWLAAFRERGVADVLGVDGPWVPRAQREIPEDLFLEHDLARPFSLDRSFDLALCLEAAEHLPPEAALPLVESLTRIAPIVAFSAAIPHQGGDGHVNEQWPSYWAKLFASCGYDCVDSLRQRLWADDAVEFWYRQNMLCLLARDRRKLPSGLACADAMPQPLDIVHPIIYLRTVANLKRHEHNLCEFRVKLASANEKLTSTRMELTSAKNELTSIKGTRVWRVYQAVRPALAAAKRAVLRL
jgi:SAM-dependent methyltransferase